MCYFLYGHINEEAYGERFLSICQKHGYVPGGKLTADELDFKPDRIGGVYFRITGDYCDCGSPKGRGGAGDIELTLYVKWLKDLRQCKKLKALRIMRYWTGKDHTNTSIHIEELDARYLAELNDNVFYTIEYFKRYYG